MGCPNCGCDDLRIEEFDFGICRETGYHDAGERYRCLTCGDEGDADDLARCNPISVGSPEEALGGG